MHSENENHKGQPYGYNKIKSQLKSLTSKQLTNVQKYFDITNLDSLTQGILSDKSFFSADNPDYDDDDAMDAMEHDEEYNEPLDLEGLPAVYTNIQRVANGELQRQATDSPEIKLDMDDLESISEKQDTPLTR